MKRLLILYFSVFGHLTTYAQPGEIHTDVRDAHIRSSFAYLIVNGKKQLLTRDSYDTSGRMTGTCEVNSYNKHPEARTDTFLVYTPGNFTRIALERNDEYDSVQYNHETRNGRNFDERKTWRKGKVVLVQNDVYDSLPVMSSSTDQTKSVHTATFYVFEYQFDSLNRITEMHQKKYEDDGLTRKLMLDFWNTTTYDSDFLVRRLYSTISGVTTNTSMTFTSYDHRIDSCVMFDNSGQVFHTFTLYKNKSGRDSLSVERSSDGKIINRNVTEYIGDTIRFVHYTADGINWETQTRTYNKAGLITSEIETDNETGISKQTVYEYLYY